MGRREDLWRVGLVSSPRLLLLAQDMFIDDGSKASVVSYIILQDLTSYYPLRLTLLKSPPQLTYLHRRLFHLL